MSDFNLQPRQLPSISEAQRRTKALAMLDAIISPDWQDRYYSYNRLWGPDEEMASMRDGSGDDWFLLFSPVGAALKGLAHELTGGNLVAQEISRSLPAAFSSFVNEPAFSIQHATFCYWISSSETSWSKVPSGLESCDEAEDGSAEMLALLVSGPTAYKAWAEEYYEAPVSLDTVTLIYKGELLTEAMIRTLNPDADVAYTIEQAAEIGYPCRAA